MEFPHIDDMKSSATPDEEIQKLKDSLYSIDLNIEKIETMMKKRINEIKPKINYSDEKEVRLKNLTEQIKVEKLINDRPRLCLNLYSPNETIS